MRGQPDARQPPSRQTAPPPGMKALRQLATAQQRAKAASARAVALSGLALEFGQRLAAVRHALRGDALEAALAALGHERHAAEQALLARLAGEAEAERQAIARQFRARPADSYRAAAEALRRLGIAPVRPPARQAARRTPAGFAAAS